MPRLRAAAPPDGRELSALLELSQLLGAARSFRAALEGALATLCEGYGAAGATAALVDEATGELRLEASAGLPGARRSPVRLRPGEGITGCVVTSGKAIVVPQVSREPLLKTPHEVLPSSTVARGELSFVSVPLVVEGRTMGALGLALSYDPSRDFARTTSFLKPLALHLHEPADVHGLAQERGDDLQERGCAGEVSRGVVGKRQSERSHCPTLDDERD